jgi:hypothetical protein
MTSNLGRARHSVRAAPHFRSSLITPHRTPLQSGTTCIRSAEHRLGVLSKPIIPCPFPCAMPENADSSRRSLAKTEGVSDISPGLASPRAYPGSSSPKIFPRPLVGERARERGILLRDDFTWPQRQVDRPRPATCKIKTNGRQPGHTRRLNMSRSSREAFCHRNPDTSCARGT